VTENAVGPTASEPPIHTTYELTADDDRSATIELFQQSVAGVAIGTFLVAMGVIPIRKRSDLLLSPHDLTVDATGIRVATPMTATQQTWPTFRRVCELTDVFTLDDGTGANAMVPKRAFDRAADARFRALVRSIGLLQFPSRWTNFARGVGLGVLAAVLFVIVIVIQASGRP
jgi:YcxB-like protein